MEMEFAMPFYELYFPDTWNDNNLSKNPFELIELSQMLNINIDTDFLFKIYDETEFKKGDVYIFYQNDNIEIFIYFDLLKDEFDQMAMINFGVRVKTEIKYQVKEILKKLYFKSTTRTDFQEDYFNQSLNRIASNSIPNQKRVAYRYMNGQKIS